MLKVKDIRYRLEIFVGESIGANRGKSGTERGKGGGTCAGADNQQRRPMSLAGCGKTTIVHAPLSRRSHRNTLACYWNSRVRLAIKCR
jgi:hypothetical protein